MMGIENPNVFFTKRKTNDIDLPDASTGLSNAPSPYAIPVKMSRKTGNATCVIKIFAKNLSEPLTGIRLYIDMDCAVVDS